MAPVAAPPPPARPAIAAGGFAAGCSQGNESRIRETACDVSLVWSVESTRWPVSAAVSTVAMVSGSRISPTRITSGFCRRILRSDPAKSGASCADLDLLDHRLAVPVNKFDGILDGHHMIAAMRVDQVDQRGQRRALAAAGGSGDQHQSLARLRESAQRRGQMQRFDRGDFFGKQTDAAGHCAALVMDIRAKTSDALAAETQVHGLGALQFAGSAPAKARVIEDCVPPLLPAVDPAAGASDPAIRSVTGAPAISSKSDAARRTASASN